MSRNVKKIKFGQEIFYGDHPDVVPYVQLSPLESEIVASYTGPGSGLAFAEGHLENAAPYMNLVAGIRDWNQRLQQAYGIGISLYEQHPISGKISGEPIADSFAICARKNNTILMVADGVNWGEKSRLAARCAMYGAMKYLNYKIFERNHKPENTQDVVRLLRKALDEAHRAIIAKDGGLTTLCLCMVCPVDNSDEHAVCCVNVGDSFAYIYASNHGIREVTVGSHDVGSERDIRDAGGAIGPVDGTNPELHNLTCSVTFCRTGDIVFLVTDGVSDNFDPVVTKIALPERAQDSNFNSREKYNSNSSLTVKPELSPQERHIYAMKEMERVAHEYELVTEEACSAQTFCGALLQHVLALTNDKRKIIENPAIYARTRMTKKEKQTRDSAIVEKMSKAPGKLDHASIVAVEVGVFTDDNAGSSESKSSAVPVPSSKHRDFVSPEFSRRALPQESPPTPTNLTLCGSVPLSPSSNNHHHKKSGARKFFAKLRSLPSSPTSPNPPQIVSSSVPNKSFFPPNSPPPPANTPQSPPHSCYPTSPKNASQTSPVKKFMGNSALPPKYPEPYHVTLKSSTEASPLKDTNKEKDARKGLDLHFSPRKFPKRHRSRASSTDLMTPTSPTIPESPLERMEGAGSVLSPQSPRAARPRPRSCIVFESNV
ncbi:Pp2c-like domain-containing protein cg9801 [Plakobranchus ocellatus]|uniref:Pp2c-like domain-containing protein cg9801 n=1 Tax=Plakobranchus ocellatus TaxID=259542 RepID=A0AAV4BLV4_9GAST|nr:Pp2c-like domain-containing protein cg9801 [Plakobranchus ocellatus]